MTLKCLYLITVPHIFWNFKTAVPAVIGWISWAHNFGPLIGWQEVNLTGQGCQPGLCRRLDLLALQFISEKLSWISGPEIFLFLNPFVGRTLIILFLLQCNRSRRTSLRGRKNFGLIFSKFKFCYAIWKDHQVKKLRFNFLIKYNMELSMILIQIIIQKSFLILPNFR